MLMRFHIVIVEYKSGTYANADVMVISLLCGESRLLHLSLGRSYRR